MGQGKGRIFQKLCQIFPVGGSLKQEFSSGKAHCHSFRVLLHMSDMAFADVDCGGKPLFFLGQHRDRGCFVPGQHRDRAGTDRDVPADFRLLRLRQSQGDGFHVTGNNFLCRPFTANCPDPETAPPTGEPGESLPVRRDPCSGEPLAGVENFKENRRPRQRGSGPVRYPDGEGPHRGIAAGLIQQSHHAASGNNFLPHGVSEAPGMQQQGPGCRRCEPAPVQSLLRLAGSQKMPAAIHPDLHPGVVVVAVGPAGGVDLPGGDAHGPVGVDGKGGFLAAAAKAAAPGGGCGNRAVIRQPVCYLTGVPIIHPDGGLIFRQTGQEGRQLIIHSPAAVGQLLLVDPGMEHIVQENVLRQVGGIGGGPAQHDPVPCQTAEQGRGSIQPVAEGAGGIAPDQGLGIVGVQTLQRRPDGRGRTGGRAGQQRIKAPPGGGIRFGGQQHRGLLFTRSTPRGRPRPAFRGKPPGFPHRCWGLPRSRR